MTRKTRYLNCAAVLMLLIGSATICTGQLVPITFNNDLSTNSLGLENYGNIPQGSSTIFVLPGSHVLSYAADGGRGLCGPRPSVRFSVSAEGVISYESGLEGILGGSGTGQLLVHGSTITVDNQLSTNSATCGGIGFFLPQAVFTLNLLPGGHLISYRADGDRGPLGCVALPHVCMTVTSSGTVSYDGDLEGILSGAGTTNIALRGAMITVDNQLSTSDATCAGIPGFLPHSTTLLNLLPGAHLFSYRADGDRGPLGCVALPHVCISVTSAGTVSYDADLEGILAGAGTTSLALRGATIMVDNQLSTSDATCAGIPGFLPHSTITFNLLPGAHLFSYRADGDRGPLGCVALPHVCVTISRSGTVSYDADLEGIVLGEGTPAITLQGVTVDITNGLSAYALSCGGIPFFIPNATLSLQLFPGEHLIHYTSGDPTPHFCLTVTRSHTVEYDSALEGVLGGFSTPHLSIYGNEIYVAASSAGTVVVDGLGQIPSCEPVFVLPGGHRLFSPVDNVQFAVSVDGLIEFDSSLDVLWAGRGTSTLQFRDSAGTPNVCNSPPSADCGLTDVNVQATEPGGASVTLNGTASSDPDGDPLSYHWDVSDLSVSLDDPDSPMPSGVFHVGTTMATLTVRDGKGGVDTCDVLITVTADSTPPVVTCTTDVAMLWPPDHTMRQVTLYVVAEDGADTSGLLPPVVYLRSDEPDDANGNGDGNTTGDVNGSDGFAAPVEISSLFVWVPTLGEHGTWVATVDLRAERAGSEDGRCYTIDASAADAFGNQGVCSSCIVVPHDRRQ